MSVNLIQTKRAAEAVFVAIMAGSSQSRGLQLIDPLTRAVRAFDIHELLTTDQAGASPGQCVDRVAFVGFVEFTIGGIVAVGDMVRAKHRTLGTVAGFDLTHAPNHINIVLHSQALADGNALELAPGDGIVFSPQPVEDAEV